jgi:hypothetical protein
LSSRDFSKITLFIYYKGIRATITDEITRGSIIDRVGRAKYDRFLFYLMGPYKSFNLNYVLSEEERREIEIDDLPGPLRRLFRNKDDINAAQALLRHV